LAVLFATKQPTGCLCRKKNFLNSSTELLFPTGHRLRQRPSRQKQIPINQFTKNSPSIHEHFAFQSDVSPMNSSSKTILSLILGFSLVGGTLFFLKTRMWQRWDIDPQWAAQIIEDAQEVQNQLSEYHTNHGKFPDSLGELASDLPGPTPFHPQEDDERWHYRKLGPDDYELFAIASSWVSSYDAIVLRYSRNYPDQWFRLLDSSHTRKFGDWWYITAFSSLQGD
jgi:hypothetical protein